MKVFRIACTGPCGDRPPGSQRNCSEMVLVPWTDVRLPKDGEPLTPKIREALLGLGRTVCDRLNPSDCQVWAGACTGLDTYLEVVYDEVDRAVIPEVDVLAWLRSLLLDPECVPDLLRHAMETADNTEALDRLVAYGIRLRRRPVSELHLLNDPVTV
jgi:hypothetical protein